MTFDKKIWNPIDYFVHVIYSLHVFVHVMAAQLLWHVQNLVESIKTTFRENVSTGVLDKDKELYSKCEDKDEKLYDVSTHWGRVTHICVGKLIILGSDNGLAPGRRQAIIWISAGVLLIGPLGTNFSEILIAIQTFSFKKMHLKMSSAKWRLFCLGLNVFRHIKLHMLK